MSTRNIVISSASGKPVLIDFDDYLSNDIEALPSLIRGILFSRSQALYFRDKTFPSTVNARVLDRDMKKRFDSELLDISRRRYSSAQGFVEVLEEYRSRKFRSETREEKPSGGESSLLLTLLPGESLFFSVNADGRKTFLELNRAPLALRIVLGGKFSGVVTANTERTFDFSDQKIRIKYEPVLTENQVVLTIENPDSVKLTSVGGEVSAFYLPEPPVQNLMSNFVIRFDPAQARERSQRAIHFAQDYLYQIYQSYLNDQTNWDGKATEQLIGILNDENLAIQDGFNTTIDDGMQWGDRTVLLRRFLSKSDHPRLTANALNYLLRQNQDRTAYFLRRSTEAFDAILNFVESRKFVFPFIDLVRDSGFKVENPEYDAELLKIGRAHV